MAVCFLDNWRQEPTISGPGRGLKRVQETYCRRGDLPIKVKIPTKRAKT